MFWPVVLSALLLGVSSKSPLKNHHGCPPVNASYCTYFSNVQNTLFAGQLNALGSDIRDVEPQEKICPCYDTPCYNITVGTHLTFGGCNGRSPFGLPALNVSMVEFCNPEVVSNGNSCKNVNLDPIGEVKICCCVHGSKCNYHEPKPIDSLSEKWS